MPLYPSFPDIQTVVVTGSVVTTAVQSGSYTVVISGTQVVTGTVALTAPVIVSNFPVTQTITGSVSLSQPAAVSVSNFPGTQIVAGTVTSVITGTVQTAVTNQVTVTTTGSLPVTFSGVTTITGTVLALPTGVQTIAGTVNAAITGTVNVSTVGTTTVAGTVTSVITGTVNTNVTNFPATQTITGSVGITNFPATQIIQGAVSIGNVVAVTSTGSLPVTVMSNFQTSVTSSLSALNQTVTIVSNNSLVVGGSIRGTWVGTITAEGTVNGQDWFTVRTANKSTNDIVQTYTANDDFEFYSVGGCTQLRVRMSAFTSGLATITLVGTNSTSAELLNYSGPDADAAPPLRHLSFATLAEDGTLRALRQLSTAPTGSTFALPTRAASYSDGRDGYQPEGASTTSTGPAQTHIDPDGRAQTYSSVLTNEGSFRDDFVGGTLNTRWTSSTATGGTVGTPTNSTVTIATTTTNGSAASIYDAVTADVGPMTFTAYASVSGRFANRTIILGMAESNSVSSPGAGAYFSLTGTTATQITCVSAASAAAADQQTTTVTLPNGLDTSTSLRYKVDVSATQVTFSIGTGSGDDVIVARHQLHIPLDVSLLGSIVGARNTGATTAASIVLDGVYFANWNRLQIDTDYIGEPLQVTLPNTPSVSTGNLGSLNAAVTIPVGTGNSIGMSLSAGTLIGTIAVEVSFNAGSAWEASTFNGQTAGRDTTIVFTSANTAQNRTIPLPGGATHVRVRVSAFTSGTASCELRSLNNSELGVSILQGTRASYVVGVSGQANTAASHAIVIEASSTKRILVRKLIIMHPGTQTTAGLRTMVLERTSGAGTGGTITFEPNGSASSFISRMDTKDPTFGGICRAKPTALGTQSTTLWLATVFVPTALAAFVPVQYDFEAIFGKPFVIQPGTTNGIALRDLGAAGAANFAAQIVFTEE